MNNDYIGHFGLHVDYTRFKKPVAMLLVDWEPAASRDLKGHEFGDRLLHAIRRATKAKKSKTMPNVWHTNGVQVQFGYRDGQADETLTLTVQCHAFWAMAIQAQPLTPAEQREMEAKYNGGVPPLIRDGLMPNADQYWWKWKAAYQKNGFFLLAYASKTRGVNWNINWHQDTPILAISDLDFMEIAAWEKVASMTEEAKEDVQMMGNIWGMVDRAIRGKLGDDKRLHIGPDEEGKDEVE
jgi:hypothetical protein